MVTSFFQQSFIYTSFGSCRSNVETSMKKLSQYRLIKAYLEMNCVFEGNFPIVSSDGPRTALNKVRVFKYYRKISFMKQLTKVVEDSENELSLKPV